MNEDEPIKPVLTKELEFELIEGYCDKVYETLKTSQALHEILVAANIEKESILSALYGD